MRSKADEDEDQAPRVKRLPAAAMLATAAMASAIVYNTLLDDWGRGGGRKNTLEAEDGFTAGTTKMLVDGGETPVVTLRYDPTVEAVQKELLASGFYKGPVDGVFGKRTRKAISDYETTNGLPDTGKATPQLIEHIKFTREVTQASRFTGSTGEAAPEEPEASADPIDPPAAVESAEDILRVQKSLAELGYAPGPIDGVMSAATRRAIREFERDRGLAETGGVNGDVVMELAKMSSGGETQN